MLLQGITQIIIKHSTKLIKQKKATYYSDFFVLPPGLEPGTLRL
jgi:hypothetical protein